MTAAPGLAIDKTASALSFAQTTMRRPANTAWTPDSDYVRLFTPNAATVDACRAEGEYLGNMRAAVLKADWACVGEAIAGVLKMEVFSAFRVKGQAFPVLATLQRPELAEKIRLVPTKDNTIITELGKQLQPIRDATLALFMSRETDGIPADVSLSFSFEYEVSSTGVALDRKRP